MCDGILFSIINTKMDATAHSTLPPTKLLIKMHVKHTLSYLYIQSSSWRWTLQFKTCRRHKKL